MADNESLRVALSCLYHLIESIRRLELIEKLASSQERRAALAASRARFIEELGWLMLSWLLIITGQIPNERLKWIEKMS